jgi:alpha-galactosidase
MQQTGTSRPRPPRSSAAAARALLLLQHLLLRPLGTSAWGPSALPGPAGAGAAGAGPAPLAWTTWNAFRFEYNETDVLAQAQAMVDSGLHAVGYDVIQLDDGWMSCDRCEQRYYGCQCVQPSARDAVTGFIRHNASKFPRGMAAIAADLHKMGLRIGLYVAAGTTTCGGFSGSLGHEGTDARMMARWQMDWVKLDNCNYADVPTLVASQRVFAAAMAATGREMVLEIGSATSPRVFNPRQN